MEEWIVLKTTALLRERLPNLFLYIKEKALEKFIVKGYEFTTINNGLTRPANFLSAIFQLAEEIIDGTSNTIQTEFYGLNMLLGRFESISCSSKKLRKMIKGCILNFSQQSILDAIGELAACRNLLDQYSFDSYEHPLSNGKSIDFGLKDINGNKILVEVINVKVDTDKYSEDGFDQFIKSRLVKKLKDKTSGCSEDELKSIWIYMILHGLTSDIILQQYTYWERTRSHNDEGDLKYFAPTILLPPNPPHHELGAYTGYEIYQLLRSVPS